eukprot:m.19120 g.19120  ORF g.19120 m.19120 type:complete len:99 (-) comp8414_c1_seq1:19-315(-)
MSVSSPSLSSLELLLLFLASSSPLHSDVSVFFLSLLSIALLSLTDNALLAEDDDDDSEDDDSVVGDGSDTGRLGGGGTGRGGTVELFLFLLLLLLLLL